MHAIVSPLDKAYYEQVEELWAELQHDFGVQGVYITPYPHFSYQIAAHYDLDKLLPRLRHFAAHHAPFTIRTSSLGIFTGTSPVLYIAVTRTAQLSYVQHILWRQGARCGTGVSPYYHPDQWMPHITIGFADVNSENLPPIMRSLSTRNFSWEISIKSLALIYDTGTRQELREQYLFSGKSAHPVAKRRANLNM